MPLLLRALLAFLALPGVIAFGIPLLMIAGNPHRPSPVGWPILAAGVVLLIWCVVDFLVRGRGTLAPWDPPRALVASGPYRVSRNPMYIGVTLILIGWAVAYRMPSLAIYAVIVPVAFHARVRLNEEPFLRQTHGAAFDAYCKRVPRWLFRRWWMAIVVWSLVALAILGAGAVAESVIDARAARDFAPPGTLIDVGGRRLHLLCIGTGTPTVLLEPSGAGTGSTSAAALRQRLAARTRVCSYDRAGMGWSDPAPPTLSAGALADDLTALQDRADLTSPLVIIASSIGGLTAELFARRHPERVGALVMLDAANSLALPLIEPKQTLARWAACGATTAATVGLVRYLDPFHIDDESGPGVARSAAFAYRPQSIETLCAMTRALPETIREFAAAPPLRSDLPLVVLTAERDQEIAVLGASLLGRRVLRQQEFARATARSSWRLVPGSDHLLAQHEPDAVFSAVRPLVEQLR